MMKSIKKEYLILGVIIVVLFFYLLVRKTDKVHYNIPKLEPVKAEDMDKIEITKSDQTVKLVKKDSKWVIDPEGYPTAEDKVKRIIDTVSQLTLTDLVSRSKNYSLYDLHKEKVIHVKAYKKDDVLRDFEIGKVGAAYGHTFVKIKDDANVYYARESFRSHFDVETDELRDKMVMKLDSNEITEVEVEQEGKKHLFAKQVKTIEPQLPAAGKKDEKKGETPPPQPQKPEEEISWLTPDGKKGDKSKLDSLIGQLTNLSCENYIAGKTKDNYNTEPPIYKLKLKGSKDFTLSIFKKLEEGDEKGKYPAVSSENSYPFLLSSWKGDQIMKKPEDLVEKKEDKK